MGDGNINYVYIVEGPAGAVCVKQGPPYVRVMKSWALSQVRELYGDHRKYVLPALYPLIWSETEVSVPSTVCE